MNPLLVTNPTNIRYLTGFVGLDARDAYILQTPGEIYFFTSSLYIEQAKSLSPILITRENPISQELKKLCEKLKIKKLEFEETDLTVAEYNKLKTQLKNISLIPSQNKIEDSRMIKKPREIEYIRAAAKITDDCFDVILGKLAPGLTESDIAWEIQSFFRKNGAESAFSPIVAFGNNSSIPHFQPTRRVLVGKDIILLDFGAKVNGYCADMTRVVFLGTPKEEWVKAHTAVLTAQQTALDLLTRGERDGKTLDQAARSSIEQANLPPYPHSLGHALGLDIHEAPRISIHKPATLAQNMVVTVEPGVYIEGQYGIRIEDLVLLRDKGIEILSKSSKTMTVL